MTRPFRQRKTLVRRLALAKLRELKRQGLSYREIGRHFGAPGAGPGSPAGYRHRLPPERLLLSGGINGSAGEGNHLVGGTGDDTQLFLRALDALDQGIAFFDGGGELLCANRALRELLDGEPEGQRIRAELELFAATVWSLARLRGVEGVESVEEMAVQDIPSCPVPITLKGNYIGLDLFGTGTSILISVVPQTNPLSPEVLTRRFALTSRECSIAQLLAAGRSNADIAKELILSQHTVRRHTEHILRKLDVHSRAGAVSRLLRDEDF